MNLLYRAFFTVKDQQLEARQQPFQAPGPLPPPTSLGWEDFISIR